MPIPTQPTPGKTDAERIVRLEQEINRLKDSRSHTDRPANAPAPSPYVSWVALIISFAAIILALLSLLKS